MKKTIIINKEDIRFIPLGFEGLPLVEAYNEAVEDLKNSNASQIIVTFETQ